MRRASVRDARCVSQVSQFRSLFGLCYLPPARIQSNVVRRRRRRTPRPSPRPRFQRRVCPRLRRRQFRALAALPPRRIHPIIPQQERAPRRLHPPTRRARPPPRPRPPRRTRCPVTAARPAPAIASGKPARQRLTSRRRIRSQPHPYRRRAGAHRPPRTVNLEPPTATHWTGWGKSWRSRLPPWGR